MKALIKFSTNRSILILLVGIFILMSILAPRKFLTFSNMISMSYQTASQSYYRLQNRSLACKFTGKGLQNKKSNDAGKICSCDDS